ncbi:MULTISPECIES: helix-turn-helix domain-containing protein [Halorussus]|uniref:helix-turn-helix domain-containing protein n=1 Tax=Halorussus TaxID=1070314 RepID=UPI00209FA946|nr:helix-turn-helix domain-containing protein [Halorussus vallis]USZ74295.1 helix-turn-helix domain-containing protein [Halorussus vallis]
MLTARISVRYPDDWTEEIGRLGVSGDIYTATLHQREYMGLIRIRGERLDESLELIREAPYHESVEVVQHDRAGAASAGDAATRSGAVSASDRSSEGRASGDETPAGGPRARRDEQATVLVTAHLKEETPFLVMLEHGYMPLDPTTLKHGREFFDLIIRSRDRLFDLVELLEPVGDVQIERVRPQVETPTLPSQVAWNELLGDLTDRQFEALSLAVESGYFAVPREATLADVADAMGVRKSTAGEHLRRALGHVAAFVVEHRS